MNRFTEGGIIPPTEYSPVRIGNVAKVRRGPRAQAPDRPYDGDAGFDLAYAGDGPLQIMPGTTAQIPTEIGIQWPPGVWGFIVGRSSTFKLGLLVNPTVIDGGWRGDLFVYVRNIIDQWVEVEPGRRLAQIVPMPILADGIEMFDVPELDPHERGTNGFGSSGA